MDSSNTSNKEKKLISFLATGSEIIHGDIQETNCRHFAKILTEKGGSIYQHIQVSDKQPEISAALEYLLSKSDAVIVTGGLGPTSDDTTRFAIAAVTQDVLVFNDSAWNHIVKRLEGFHLPVNESNRQQALFPVHAELYPNNNGTAFGCHLLWQHKHIFMLPGPPSECRPIFDKYILPTFIKQHYFSEKITYRWLTIGLSEGEIAPQIDAIAKPYPVETGFRWHYPYIEIKIFSDKQTNIETLVETIEALLKPNLVSHNQKEAFELLKERLATFPKTIYLIDNITDGQFSKEISYPNLQFLDPSQEIQTHDLLFKANSSKNLLHQSEHKGTIKFDCAGYINKHLTYTHSISIPNRGLEIIYFAKCYIAWQLLKFLETTA